MPDSMHRKPLVPIVFAAVVLTLGLCALGGWLAGNKPLQTGSGDSGAVPMNPTTALTFIMGAVALVLLQSRPLAVRLGRWAAAAVAFVGIVKLADYALGLNSQIDRLLFVERLGDNHMAPNTAAGFVLVGLAMMLRDVPWRGRRFAGELLAAAAAILSFLCLVGYLLAARAMYGVGGHIPMAANTALAFEVLSLGILLSRPERGLIAVLRSARVGGAAARRLLPVAVVLPVVLGWFCEMGRARGLYDAAFAAALMVTVCAVLFSGAICWTAFALNKVDRARQRAERQLRSACADLDQRVAQRTAELVAANHSLARRNQEIDMFRLLVESVQDYAIIMLDPQGRVVSWNAGAQRIKGYTAQEILGRHYSVFFPSEADAQRAAATCLSVAAADGHSQDEGWRLRQDGSQFWAHVVITAVSDAAGRLVGFGEVTRDLTERRAAELSARRAADELKQREDQLRHAQKMEAVGTLAGGVAHEFNNLLQAMQAYTQFAMEGLPSEDPRYQDLEQVLSAAGRAAGLTRQLLGFGRRQALELANINPNQLVSDVVKLVRPLIGATISVEVGLDEGVGMIHADAGQFQQLLMNLCINARDAMPDGGTLLIKTDDVRLSQRYCDVHPDVEPGRYLALAVSDTGTGMPPDVVEHIFEPFYTTKEVGKGTGLGLSMVYGLVQQHHGAIRVYSEVGLGTTFRIYLPTVDAGESHPAADNLPARCGGTETILIADDEPQVHNVYMRVLRAAGYTLLSARDGREAWEMFQAHQDEIDLLLLDVMMPHMSGREVHRRIQDVRPRLPVIFSSGYDPETAHVRFAEDAGLPFLQKPFDPDRLLRAVRQVLDEEACVAK